jgi:hypothetical protein
MEGGVTNVVGNVVDQPLGGQYLDNLHAPGVTGI